MSRVLGVGRKNRQPAAKTIVCNGSDELSGPNVLETVFWHLRSQRASHRLAFHFCFVGDSIIDCMMLLLF